MKKLYTLFLSLTVASLINHPSAYAQKYSVTPFPDQIWCPANNIPTAYVTLGVFSINEINKKAFKKNQNDDIILTLPAGFEFNPAAPHTVTFNGGNDILSITLNSVTATTITITVVTDNNENAIDTIFFNNFEIRCTMASASGNLYRTGGAFLIDNSVNNPVESLGFMADQTPMGYISSAVTQLTTAPIRKSCGDNSGMLQIAIDVSGSCNALEVTKFSFNTNGDIGYSQNPLTNIADAKVYYTGTNPNFNTANLFGAFGGSPNGAFDIMGTQTLNATPGTHYFFLTYDVPLTAINGDGLDARLDSFVMDMNTITNMSTPNPSGIRLINDSLCVQPDLPNPNPNPDTVPMNSLVIPMDTINQALIPPFNLKAYGLVHTLLQNDIPVKWVIRAGKGKDSIDFSANVERLFPSYLPPAMLDFRCSAFIIDSFWVDHPFYPNGQSASQIINAFGNNVAVYRLTQDEVVDVRYQLKHRTKIAVFSNGGNQAIHQAILDSAAVSNYFIINAGAFPGISECYTFCSEPHWFGGPSDTNITHVIRDYVQEGGNFLGQCKGVDTYENLNFWHTDNGINIINATVSNVYLNNDMAYMQFEGPLRNNEGGSERNWIRNMNSTWDAGFYYCISGTNQDTIVAAAAHLIPPDSVGGNVFYLGGHDYSPFDVMRQINAARMYLNASLVPAGRPTPVPLDAGNDTSICIGDSVQIGGNPTGPTNATYWWVPGTGLSDSTVANPMASPDTTTTYTVYADNDGCPAIPASITVYVDSPAFANAGTDQIVCANNSIVSLNGVISGGTTTGIWTTSGSGTFNPDDTTLNASYIPSNSDILAGSVWLYLSSTNNGGCGAAVDSMLVTITPAPTADAGPDQSVCANNPVVHLSGVVTIATGGIWSGGTGTYNPNNTTLLTDYTPSNAEINAGFVQLILTTTGNGNCLPVTDTILITITPAPVVDAGPDDTTCSNNPDVQLNGSVLIATGGQWSGGTGSYTPNDTTLNAIYSPSNAEILAGSVTLILTSTGNGNCLPVSDTIVITILPGPVVDAGPDTAVCADNPTVNLNGSVINAAGGIWSGGTGTFLPNNTTLNAAYTPSGPEITAGTVTLYLTSTGNGNCLPEMDSVVITITPEPIVDAGPDDTVCANNPNVPLNGSVTGGSTTGVWSTNGTGIFTPNDTDLNATYLPSPADTAAGMVMIVLTSTNNGGCNPHTDTMFITITPSPWVHAGPDQSICSNNPDVVLNGSVSGGSTSGIWSTSGTGAFTPSNTSLNATYHATPADTASGTVYLVLTSTNNGNCLPVSDTVIITFTPSPWVQAGPDDTICVDSLYSQLNGNIAGGTTTGIWTTSGTGVFIPDNTTLNAVYHASSQDSLNGQVTLILTSTNNGNCLPVSDTMTIYILPAGVVDAGVDDTVCANNANVQLNGSVSGGASEGIWTTSGTGTFSPDDTSMMAIYVPSPQDTVNGSVTIYLTATNSCNYAVDSIIVTISPAPVVDAGADQMICANNPVANLNATVLHAGGGTWSGGTGTYNPNNNTLNASYTASGPEVTAGSVTLYLTSTGNGNCLPVTDSIVITITPEPIVDAGPDDTSCANNPNIQLNGSVTGGTTTGQWTSSGTGTFSPNDSDLAAIYIPSPADTAAGMVYLILTSTNNGGCLPVSDTLILIITPSPWVTAGPDQTVCANNDTVWLNGSVTGGATTGQWSSSGSGLFLPNDSDMNAMYIPSPSDTAAGSVTISLVSTNNGGCLPVTDSLIITITDAPFVDAGADQLICVDSLFVPLNGLVGGGSTTGVWSTSGTGVFTPNNTTLNAVYQASSQDSLNGQVTLVLTSTNNGNCLPVSDTMIINILPAGIVDAGPDDTVCANNADAFLNGIISGGATEGIWTTSGTGIFTPNDTALNATYIPSPQDTANGMVILYLTATNSCNDVYDSLILIITPAPVVDAGPDDTVCITNPDVSLNGNILHAGGGIWTGGTGTYNPNNTTLNAVYTPSNAELIAGTLTLYLTSTGNGDCLPVADSVTITITDIPVVDAGPDDTVCSNNAIINLNGNVSGGTTTGQWSTNGTGVFIPSDTSLNGSYIATPADTAAGSILIILTSTNNGGCLPESDTMIVFFGPSPWVTAGPDQSVCANNDTVWLNGSVSGGATTGQWSSSGTGVFLPNDSDLNAMYIPSNQDTANGTVTIYLTSTNNGGCLPVTDSLIITITDAPYVDAGPDQLICVDSLFAILNAVVSGGSSTGIWSTSGTGTFSPNNTSLNAVYNASSQDSINGQVMLILTSTNNGGCLPVSDTLMIYILEPGIVDAGSDDTVCANNATVQLNGSISGGASSGIWTSSGTGTFSPNDTTLNATYLPSSADTANGIVILYLTATNSCNDVYDSVIIIITPAPYVNAGPDQIICQDSILDVQLNGIITQGASSGQWSSSGTGIFIPNNTDLNATYIPSTQDTANGSVIITLISTNNGNCLPETDTMVIYFIDPALVDAGTDDTICANAFYQLNGSVSGGFGTGIWTTSGSGTFTPSDTSLNGSYYPSPADTVSGSVMLVLTSTNNGNCPAQSDTIYLTITVAPWVFAGTDDTVCANNDTVYLNGNVWGATQTGQWISSGTGVFLPNDSDLNAIYIPSDADTANGSVTIYLNTTNNGNCFQETDSLVIIITPAPQVDGGPDLIICKDSMQIPLSGSVWGGASTALWSTLGSGTFVPDNTTLNATYLLSPGDTAAGTVTLILTSTNNGNCLPAYDTILITITSIPSVEAGPDTVVCANNANVLLNGIITGGNGTGIWSTSGTGTFSPDDTTLNATYIPSQGDTASGTIILVLTPTNACVADGDTLVVTITPAPVVDAGSNQSVCADGSAFNLSGSISGGSTTGQWWSDGTGAFIPNDSSLSVTYMPSAADDSIGHVMIILTSTNNGKCNPESDTIYLTINPVPVALFDSRPLCINWTTDFIDSSFVSGDSIVNWYWDFGDGDTSSTQNPAHSYGNSGTYDVTLIVTTSAGCKDSITLPVNATSGPTADFSMTPNPAGINITIQFTDQSTGATAWNWDFGDEIGTSTLQNPTYLYADSGNYTVVLTVSDDAGCLDTAMKEMTITGDEITPFAIPSAFTPNGDGVNDILYVKGGPYRTFDFRIFNEWGNQIFRSTDQQQGWDGTIKGKLQPAGTFVYTFEGEMIDGSTYKTAGEVTLVNLQEKE